MQGVSLAGPKSIYPTTGQKLALEFKFHYFAAGKFAKFNSVNLTNLSQIAKFNFLEYFHPVGCWYLGLWDEYDYVVVMMIDT